MISSQTLTLATLLSHIASTPTLATPTNQQPKIIGGTDVTKDEFPFYVHLLFCKTNQDTGKKYCSECGASLIHDNWVLTAAHCVVDFSSAILTFGLHETLNLAGTEERSVTSSDFIIHQNYWDSSSGKPYKNETGHEVEVNFSGIFNDIALIHLDNPMNNFKTIPLAGVTAKNANFTVIGSGAIEYGGDTSDFLQKVDIDFMEIVLCKEKIGEIDPSIKIDEETQFCLGEVSGGKDSCQGDSGGPAFLKVGSNESVNGGEIDASVSDFLQFGIVSYGIGCGGKDSPGVYTEVASYADWLFSVTNGTVKISPVDYFMETTIGLTTTGGNVILNATTVNTVETTEVTEAETTPRQTIVTTKNTFGTTKKTTTEQQTTKIQTINLQTAEFQTTSSSLSTSSHYFVIFSWVFSSFIICK